MSEVVAAHVSAATLGGASAAENFSRHAIRA
jgi:hypothetical protein